MKKLIVLFSVILLSNAAYGVEAIESYKAPEYEYKKIDEKILTSESEMKAVIDERQAEIDAWEEKSKELNEKGKDTSEIDNTIREAKIDLQGLQVAQSEYATTADNQKLIDSANKIIDEFDTKTETAEKEINEKIDEINVKIAKGILETPATPAKEPANEPMVDPKKPTESFIVDWLETSFRKVKNGIKNFFGMSTVDPITSHTPSDQKIFDDFKIIRTELDKATQEYLQWKNFYITNALGGDITQFTQEKFNAWVPVLEERTGRTSKARAAIDNYERASEVYNKAMPEFLEALERTLKTTSQEAAKAIYDKAQKADLNRITLQDVQDANKKLKDVTVQGEFKTAVNERFKDTLFTQDEIEKQGKIPFDNPYSSLGLENNATPMDILHAYANKVGVKNLSLIADQTQQLIEGQMTLNEYKNALGDELFTIADAYNILTDAYIGGAIPGRAYAINGQTQWYGKRYVDNTLNSITEDLKSIENAYPDKFTSTTKQAEGVISTGERSLQTIANRLEQT